MSLLACGLAAVTLLFPLVVGIIYKLEYRKIDPHYHRELKIKSIMASFTGAPELRKVVFNYLKKGNHLQTLLLHSKMHEEFKQKYGTLVDGLKTKDLGFNITTITPIFKILMKLMIAVGVTFLLKSPVFVTFIFQTVILVELMFNAYFQPYVNRLDQVRQVFTGISCLILSYHLLLFTDFVDSASFPKVANSSINIICFNAAGDILLTVFPFFIAQVNNTKLIFLRWRHKKSGK